MLGAHVLFRIGRIQCTPSSTGCGSKGSKIASIEPKLQAHASIQTHSGQRAPFWDLQAASRTFGSGRRINQTSPGPSPKPMSTQKGDKTHSTFEWNSAVTAYLIITCIQPHVPQVGQEKLVKQRCRKRLAPEGSHFASHKLASGFHKEF